MAKKETSLPDYWSVYRAINFQRFSKDKKYIDRKSGKRMQYKFIGEACLNDSLFFHAFSGILWMSFPLLIILLSVMYSRICPTSFLIGALVIIGYHFAAMYYLIRGSHIEISEVKKK